MEVSEQGVVYVYLGTLNIRRAAVFWISCREEASLQGVAVVQAVQDHCLDEELI